MRYKKNDKLILGINFGDHGINLQTLIKDIESQVVGVCDSFILRSKPEFPLSLDDYIAIAKFANKHKIYFAILYAYQHPPKGKVSHLDKEKVTNIKRFAGKYFLGEIFAESGSQFTAMDKGYYIETPDETIAMPKQNAADMAEARENYVKHLKSMLDYDKSIGIDNCIMIEPTATGCYALEAGFDTLMLEMLPGNPDKLIPFTRGASNSYKKNEWGALIAHEWYGGYSHYDELKRKRLELAYKYLYMQGSNYIFIESGISDINSFGEKQGYNSNLCKNYRNIHSEFSKFAKENPRPILGPYVDFAFIYGEDDGYSDFLGGSAWCQFDRAEWGKSDAERSWEILDDIYRSYDWFSSENLEDHGHDLSSSPAYGTYDVIHASSDVSVFKKYKYLAFVGHSTMTQKLCDKLIEYVRSGGILLASAAHLNTVSDRSGKFSPIDNDAIEHLFGVRLGDKRIINEGIKFIDSSFVGGVKYPFSQDGLCDSNYPSGYSEIVTLELCAANVKAKFCDSFDKPKEDSPAVLTEYKNGKGVAILLPYVTYPGNPAVYPIYRLITKQLVIASHRKASVKVFGSDKVRFSVYFDENGKIVVYLLNTSFDCPISAGIEYNRETHLVCLDALELKKIYL